MLGTAQSLLMHTWARPTGLRNPYRNLLTQRAQGRDWWEHEVLYIPPPGFLSLSLDQVTFTRLRSFPSASLYTLSSESDLLSNLSLTTPVIVTVVAPTDHPKSVLNRCVIERVLCLYVTLTCTVCRLDVFVIRLRQISFPLPIHRYMV